MSSSYNNYYYRQQVSSARPRYIPPPLEKIGNGMSMSMSGPSGFYGNPGNYFNSSMHNTSSSGRSNRKSPTYTGLTEVLASYIPGDSTIVFMNSKSSSKWWKGKTAKFMACFFLFTLVVSGIFLYKNGMQFPREYISFNRPNEIEWTSESEINPSQDQNKFATSPNQREEVNPPNLIRDQHKVVNSPNPSHDQKKVINPPDEFQGSKVISPNGGDVEDFVKPIKIIYSVDEDDGEVHIESFS